MKTLGYILSKWIFIKISLVFNFDITILAHFDRAALPQFTKYNNFPLSVDFWPNIYK